MARLGHGDVRPPRSIFFSLRTDAPEADPTQHFGYMFPGLQDDPAHHLPEGPATVAALKALALTMSEREGPPVGGAGAGNSDIPAGYTYFGQFVDHDITLDGGSAAMATLASPDLVPLASLAGLKNGRSALLDLDSVYGETVPRNGDRLKVGLVTRLGGDAVPTLRPAGKGDANDLPRNDPDPNAPPATDREAQIGDPRNDENVIIAQLHTAFLKAHNSLIDDGLSFDDARRTMRRHYQSIVLHDYAPRICDPAVVADVLANGPRMWTPASRADLFMPAEFAAAAYRFGHSMIRTSYNYNLNFNPRPGSVPGTLALMFTFTALQGQIGNQNIGEQPTLPDNWIIEWEHFVDLPGETAQRARAINTLLTEFTSELRDVLGQPEGTGEADPDAKLVAPRLAMRNLLRGYFFRLPTGQAVARAMGEPVLEGQALIDALPPAQHVAAQPFATATPLWFYVLAEAGAATGGNGQHLGRVGSRIVAETLWNLVRFASDSILDPANPSPDIFTLADLVQLAARQDIA